jgi:hypothetical protein
MRSPARAFTLSADQRNAGDQFNYGFCLQNDKGALIDVRLDATYFRLCVHQGISDAVD